ncbi:pyridoxamine 5'-phosphate oxidase family protein [Streptomyces sp. NPDC101165]|uniref:pyridoxamine 5'-phosphate oxidase family protein n=1 Tax=Streptomyces sp. NPDC101165 TaxID=3366119 RepID=UPI003807F1BC
MALSFDWDGELATETDCPSGRNVTDTWTTRLVLDHTQDMSVIDGEVEVLAIDEQPQEQGDRLAARSGFDPRTLTTPCRRYRITPRRIQAWCEESELRDRPLMCDGRWAI